MNVLPSWVQLYNCLCVFLFSLVSVSARVPLFVFHTLSPPPPKEKMDVSIVCCWFWFLFPFCLIFSGWVGGPIFLFLPPLLLLLLLFLPALMNVGLGLGSHPSAKKMTIFSDANSGMRCNSPPPSPMSARGAPSQGSSETTLAK